MSRAIKFQTFQILSRIEQVFILKTHTTLRQRHTFTGTNNREKQKWYNDDCKRKREYYQNMLYNYNLNRNRETREIMLAAKKDYKYYCRSCKLRYSYDQGQKMNELRKKKPKEFWNLFKRKKKKNSHSATKYR